MDYRYIGPLGLRSLFCVGSLALGLIFRCMTASLQGVAYLLIGIRIADPVDLCVQSQHPAALTAVVAAPDIFRQIKVHLPAAVTADGAVHIDMAGPSPPDIQTEKGSNVHNGKGKICRFVVHRN